MDHAELVSRATRWLKNTIGCRVVLSELVAFTDTGETPDAIGWVRGYSILVECKTTRSDFKADSKKRARGDHMSALGHWRFYLTPPGLILSDELQHGWGLYEVHGNRVCHKYGTEYANAGTAPLTSCRKSEVAMLVSTLWRLQNKPA